MQESEAEHWEAIGLVRKVDLYIHSPPTHLHSIVKHKDSFTFTSLEINSAVFQLVA
jgi:hypothetical protein